MVNPSANKKSDGESPDKDPPLNVTQASDIALNKDILIHTSHPLPQYHKGEVKAYKASGKNKLSNNLVAYVCDRSLTPRHSNMVKYGKVMHQSLVKLVGAGAIFFPQDNKEQYCFVYENTLGQPLLDRTSPKLALGLRAEDVIVNVAYPLIQVLKTFRNLDLVHGEIWPGNIFYKGNISADKVTLGECLSAPASYYLPALYEPVERAMANPLLRGRGTIADDLYSFGVSLAVMLRHHDPMPDASPQKIIENKIEKGTYLTLLSKDRLNGAVLELLRGLLYDDPNQRWNLDDLEAWLDGRRLSPKQASKRVKASRPLVLNGRKFVRPELLAMDMTNHVDEMIRLIEGGDYGLWVDRAVEDKMIKFRTEQMLKEVSDYDRTDGHNARVCAALSTALYPEAPIHYQGIKFHPLAFAKAFTYSYIKRNSLQEYLDIIRSMFVIACIRVQKNQLNLSLIGKLDSCRKYIMQSSLNSGIERCIYFLNSDCHCLSPIVDKYYIQNSEQMMTAWEDLCSKENPQVLFDRHTVSFLSVRDKRCIDPYMQDLTSDQRHKRILAQIKTLATIQKRNSLQGCVGIAEWVSNNLEDIYERFHDTDKRKGFEKKIEKIKRTGDLTKIALLFEDEKLFQEDANSFYYAMQNYKKLETEQNSLIQRMQSKKNKFGQKSGQQVASVISMILSFIIMIISAYIVVIKG